MNRYSLVAISCTCLCSLFVDCSLTTTNIFYCLNIFSHLKVDIKYTYVCTYLCMDVCMYVVHTYVCMYVCTYVCVYPWVIASLTICLQCLGSALMPTSVCSPERNRTSANAGSGRRPGSGPVSITTVTAFITLTAFTVFTVQLYSFHPQHSLQYTHCTHYILDKMTVNFSSSSRQ